MAIVKQNSNGKGSLKDIQLLVNNHPQIIEREIKLQFNELINDTIIWKSPLKPNYAEYSDYDVIELLELKDKIKNLDNFWPKRGPQWDALALSEKNRIILVEAKANIPEVISPGTSAREKSKKLIVKSLNKTKLDLGVLEEFDWSGKYYQYTNRLTYLHYLRIRHNIPAYLINIYFLNDKKVNGPEKIEEWKTALTEMYKYLGIKNKKHKLSPFMADIFIDIEEFSN